MLLLSSPGVILQALGAAAHPTAPRNTNFLALIDVPKPLLLSPGQRGLPPQPLLLAGDGDAVELAGAGGSK